MIYKTIKQRAEASIEEKKSVFIGNAIPVTKEKEALDFLQEIRSAYPDARHHVYAYVLRENGTVRYSDDHEPQGTAGLPVLDVLRKGEITDAAIVVTRYFGGTLLGTGGLVRAYTQAAKAAVEAALVVTRAKLQQLYISCNYGDYQKINTYLQADGICLDDVNFGADVLLKVALLPGKKESFIHQITEVTGGRAILQEHGERYDFLPQT